MGYFAARCFCVVVLLSEVAAMNVISAGGTTGATLECTSGAQCDRRHHCVKRSSTDTSGFCELFLRFGEVCTYRSYTFAKPDEIVDQRRCSVGLMCLPMGRVGKPEEMQCTSLT